ncbi:HAD-like domain-containing protein [Stachybotrys elegans]|uniref:HAD-like domain-containing protein n=1 Tax=Stachybotrys elegans TaxID=80388 RepID=A0A8K0WVZ5_9HYPO|nr:HAD-like domain-containing protein [Stachybotrys elegans]
MSPGTLSPLSNVKALAFDVFGTVVDWRSSVVEELVVRAFRKLSTNLPEHLRSRLATISEEDWEKFAQQWRDTYSSFCKNFNPEVDAWRTVDEHHHDSLVNLLNEWGLEGLYTPTEVKSLSLVWHRLSPWPDSPDGLQQLSARMVTTTLSNGNLALLRDLRDYSSLRFRRLLSAEMFGAYKPSQAVYGGAVSELGLEPHEVAMVAAHLKDLKAARGCGLRTIYVERKQEEEWSPDDDNYKEAREWVDLWISEGEDGFVELARRI